MSKKKVNASLVTSIVVLIALLLIFLGGFFVYRMFYRDYISEVVLTENLTISPEWKEINTEGLITFEKENTFLSILLEPPFELPRGESEIRLPNGDMINPDIKMIDGDGNEYLLKYIGATYSTEGEWVNYGYLNGKFLPTDKTYVAFQMRSDSPIKTRRIAWKGYDSRDLP